MKREISRLIYTMMQFFYLLQICFNLKISSLSINHSMDLLSPVLVFPTSEVFLAAQLRIFNNGGQVLFEIQESTQLLAAL
jgi:hypothetical protein